MFQSKLKNMPPSIFAEMSNLAKKYKAINLAQGFPDFDCDIRLHKLLYSYTKKGYNQYSPLAGVPLLRNRIADITEQSYGYHPDPDTEITITAGATEGLFSAIQAMVGRGEEVIIIEPSYDSYIPAILLAGGIPVVYRLSSPDFIIDWRSVEELMSPRTRMIIINNPNNPTGKILKKKDLLALENMVVKYGIYCLSDEVYHHITFDGKKHKSTLTYEGLRSRTIAVFSFGKLLHITGWKIGYTIAPPQITEEIRKVHQHVIFSVSTPMQYAIAEYLDTKSLLKKTKKLFQRKKEFFVQSLESSALKLNKTSGSYFVLADYSEISDLPDREFANYLTSEAKVAAIPLSSFYSCPVDSKMIRFCFAKKKTTLEEATQRLLQL